MSNHRWRALNKEELIIEVWEALDCESVGAQEIGRIQEAVRERFGEGAVESPAAIARTVADEGAALRHPEVFEFDRNWREGQLTHLAVADELDFSTFETAFASLTKLNQAHEQIEKNDQQGVKRLRSVVEAARRHVLLTARSKIIAVDEREQAQEIAQWLGVWLQSPVLFHDWLDLRLRSDEFNNRFKGAK